MADQCAELGIDYDHEQEHEHDGAGIREEQVRQDGRSVLSSLTGLAALGTLFPALKRWAIAGEENSIPPSVPSA